MSPRVRTLLIAAGAAALAVVAGANVASEAYTLAILLLLVVLWVFAEWIRGPQPESWVLGAILIGYMLGNRGFAQLLLSTRAPLLPAEAVLLVCVPAMLLRTALRQTVFFRRDLLNFAIALWMLFATARLPMDVRDFGGVALRDYAMVYYAAFFFVGQSLGQHALSANLLRNAVTLGFLLLPPVAAGFLVAPDFFIQYTAFRGVPLVLHKSDLIATYLAAGYFWLWGKRLADGRRVWLIPAAVCWLMIGGMPSPRAAMVAILGVTAWWLLARVWRVLGFQFAVGAAVVAIALPVFFFADADLKRTPIYSTYEHAISIVDFQGRGNYVNRASGDPGDNNRFRLVWWRAVIEETFDESPAFGLGFGYDLSARFLANYGWIANDDFSARSPHSMALTVFGRLGFVGFGLWLLIAAAMARDSWTVFRSAELPAMSWWSIAWVLWFSGLFGVVLEGPMGAVIFWTTLGLAKACRSPDTETLDGAGTQAAPTLHEATPPPQVAAPS